MSGLWVGAVAGVRAEIRLRIGERKKKYCELERTFVRRLVARFCACLKA